MKTYSKQVVAISLLLMVIFPCHGQQNELSINSEVPDLHFQNIVNAPYASLSLQEVRNQAVIIEFWSTRCGTCAKKMYDLAALQDKFRKDLLIMTVTPESSEAVSLLYQRKPELKALGLPSVVDDQVLMKLFPVQSVPHAVWISKDRKVVAITGGNDVNEENVERLIKNRSLAHLPLKKDLVGFEDEGISLWVNGEIVRDHVIASSSLLKGITGVRSRIGVETSTRGAKITATNQSLRRLYAFAYQKKIKLLPLEIKTRVMIPPEYRGGGQGVKDSEALYCYELLLPPMKESKKARENVLDAMQKDLDRLFRVKSSVQKLPTTSFVLSPADETTNQPPVNIPAKVTILVDSIRLQNVPVITFLSHLQTAYNFGKPILYDGPPEKAITVTLPDTFNNFTQLVTFLSGLGYNLKEEKRVLESLVIE